MRALVAVTIVALAAAGSACSSGGGAKAVAITSTNNACKVSATELKGTGDVAMSEKCSFCQPSPFGTVHGSSCTLLNPHDFISPIAHVAAFFTFGDQVRRGP